MSYKAIAETNTACLEKKITEEERLSKLAEIHKSIQERNQSEHIKHVEDSEKWTTIVAEKSTEELQNIIEKKQEDYNSAFIIAAKLELENRTGKH